MKPHEASIGRFAQLSHNLCINLLRLFALGLKVRSR